MKMSSTSAGGTGTSADSAAACAAPKRDSAFRAAADEGLPDISRHVIGCHLAQETEIQNALHHVASNINDAHFEPSFL